MGLLLAAFALPVGAVLVSHVLGEQPAPRAPVEVRVGDSAAAVEGGVGRPSTSPSPAVVRPLVVGERAVSSTAGARPGLPAVPATAEPGEPAEPAGMSPVTPPRAEPTDADARSKAKGRGNSVSARPTPSHGVTSGGNGAGG